MLKSGIIRRVTAVLAIVLLLAGCTPVTNQEPEPGDQTGNSTEPVVKTAFVMGTIAKITVHDQDVSDEVFQKVFDYLSALERRMTINDSREQSEIIRLNEAAGREFVDLSPDIAYVLEKAIEFAELSEGKFDVTIGPIVKLWNIGTDEARIPDEAEIKAKLPLVGYRNIIFDKQGSKAKLNLQGMIVDLGAIGKGFAGDEAARILRESGIEHAIINLGGNVMTINAKPDGSKWRIGLQEPFAERGKYVGIVKLDNQAFVSSGVYERYFEEDGRIYHHLINPKTGYPEDNGLWSVSIITDLSIDADALSTSTYLLGLEKGRKLIERLPNTEAIFITADKKVYTTSGVDENLFELTNPDYTLVK